SIPITASDMRNSGISTCSETFASLAFRSIWTIREPKELDLMLSRHRIVRQQDFASQTCNLSIGKHQQRIQYCIPQQFGCGEGWDAEFRRAEHINSRNPSTMHPPLAAEAVEAQSRKMPSICAQNEVCRISIGPTA